MRVISGSARGTKLLPPKNNNIRPTLDSIKESLFNILAPDILNSNFLDLFAGSGAIGIEALSRGAKQATFVDSSPEAINLIKNNLIKTKLEAKAKIIQKNSISFIKTLEKISKFDIIYLDPPFYENLTVETVRVIIDNKILNKEGYIVLEIGADDDFENDVLGISNINTYRTKRYGNIKLVFVKENTNDSSISGKL